MNITQVIKKHPTVNKFKLGASCVVLLIISGCTALQPFPNVARGGDTIALAVGSPDNMTRANTSATFTSDIDSVPVDVTSNIRSIFKLYADPASKVYESTASTANLIESSGHAPWISIAVIDLPIGLTVGSGNVQFNTTANYPAIGSHINDLTLPIEIIPGTGSSNNFDYEFGVGTQAVGDLTILEPQTRAEFGPANPSAACPCPDYAAIEVKVSIPTSLGTLSPEIARVLTEDLTVQTGSGRSVLHGVSSNDQDLTIMFISPTEKLKYYEARFSVVLHSFSSFTGTPTINSVRYFDTNGLEISGPVADYSVVMK